MTQNINTYIAWLLSTMVSEGNTNLYLLTEKYLLAVSLTDISKEKERSLREEIWDYFYTNINYLENIRKNLLSMGLLDKPSSNYETKEQRTTKKNL